MEIKLVKNNSKNLIIFLTGWGCDADQFGFMKSENYDVLICYDYTDLNFDFDFSGYDEFYLITFSAGVNIGCVIKDKLPKFKKTVAINGNPLASNQYYGLRKEILEVFAGVTPSNALDFRRQFLVYDDEEFRKFNASQSHRTFESCMQELLMINQCDSSDEPMKYDVAVLSKDDKIFYFERQLEYWSDKSKCVILENTAHFPFFKLDKNYSLITMLSHDLGQAKTDIYKNSSNFVAETVFKLAGGKYASRTGSFANGLVMFNDFCQKHNIDTSDIKLVDASGVSKNTLVTPDFMTSFLLKTQNYVEMNLPTAGEGTLSTRMLYLKGFLHAKTGTLNNISAIAGYISTLKGQKYVFSIIINDKCSNGDKKMLEEYILRTIYSKG